MKIKRKLLSNVKSIRLYKTNVVDTPRTNSFSEKCAVKYNGHSADYIEMLNHARELERENIKLKRYYS